MTIQSRKFGSGFRAASAWTLAGCLLAPIIFGTPALAASRVHHRHHHAHYSYRHHGYNHDRYLGYRYAPRPMYFNRPSERGFGPAWMGQYPSFAMLDHFPSGDSG